MLSKEGARASGWELTLSGSSEQMIVNEDEARQQKLSPQKESLEFIKKIEGTVRLIADFSKLSNETFTKAISYVCDNPKINQLRFIPMPNQAEHGLTDAQFKQLAANLKNNQSLKALTFGQSNASDSAVVAIAQILNTTALRILSMDHLKYDAKTAEILSMQLKSNKTLDRVGFYGGLSKESIGRLYEACKYSDEKVKAPLIHYPPNPDSFLMHNAKSEFQRIAYQAIEAVDEKQAKENPARKKAAEEAIRAISTIALSQMLGEEEEAKYPRPKP